MKRIIVLLLLSLCLSTIVEAQIVKADYDLDYDPKHGFKDAKDNWVVKPQYSFTFWYEDWKLGTFEVKGSKAKGLLDASGKIIFPAEKYKSYYYDGQYLHITDINDKVGLARMDGSIFLPCKWKWIYVSDEYIKVTDKNGLQGLLSFEGKEIIPCKYKKVDYMKEGYFSVTNKANQKGALSIEGKEIVPCLYSRLIKAANDIFLVNKGAEYVSNKGLIGGKWGYYANGLEIIPLQYDEASVFTNGVATVKKDGEVKLIKNPLMDGSQIMIAENQSTPNKKKIGGLVVSRYPAPDSDVDKNIPTAKMQNKNLFAFIIANENYADAPVPYSLNDGRMFKEYCQKTLGIPVKNINLYEDATFGNIITAVEKMKNVADAYDGEASIIFYYAGHGFPDEKQATAYLLPVDGDASNIKTTGYSLSKLYKEIAEMKLKSAFVFLDACFSGAKREDQMLSQARGVAIKVKEEAPQGNMVVFSAAQGDETAHQLEEKHHGLFTYCLLKELQQSNGNVTLGTLTENVTKQVKRQSVVINNKKQTPTVIPSQTLINSWQNMQLK